MTFQIKKAPMNTDGSPKTKFKRYYTGSGPGKGSDRRDMQVSEEEFAENWDKIFGPKTEPTSHPDDCDHPHCNPAF